MFSKKCLESAVSPSIKYSSSSGGCSKLGSYTFPLLQHKPAVSPLNFFALQTEHISVMELISTTAERGGSYSQHWHNMKMLRQKDYPIFFISRLQ